MEFLSERDIPAIKAMVHARYQHSLPESLYALLLSGKVLPSITGYKYLNAEKQMIAFAMWCTASDLDKLPKSISAPPSPLPPPLYLCYLNRDSDPKHEPLLENFLRLVQSLGRPILYDIPVNDTAELTWYTERGFQTVCIRPDSYQEFDDKGQLIQSTDSLLVQWNPSCQSNQ